MVETDVLVVGSGPAGASAAPFLSSLGVDALPSALRTILHGPV